MNKRALEAIDRTLQDIRKCKNIFGSILTILVGDFRQTLPVVCGGCRPDEVSSCIKWSYLWQKVKAYSLMTNMCVHLHNDRNAAQFAQTLLKVGNGKMLYQKNSYITTIPSDLAITTNDINTPITFIYPDLERNHKDSNWLMERAI